MGGCMLMNSRGGPPILRGGPPLGTISMVVVCMYMDENFKKEKISIGQDFVKTHRWVL